MAAICQVIETHFRSPYVWQLIKSFLLSIVGRSKHFSIPNGLATKTFFQLVATIVFNHWQLNFSHLLSSCIEFDKSFQKTYYMPPFQIQLLMIEKFRLPSNNPNFLDGEQNPYLVAIHMAIKNFWSPTIWWSKLVLVVNDYYLLSLTIKFLVIFNCHM